MYTPGFTLIRKAQEDYKIPNSKHIIPKGTGVWIPNIAFQNDANIWKNPNKFNPDRMTPDQIAQRPAFAFMPFG
jgi:cytochrome P450 family 6